MKSTTLIIAVAFELLLALMALHAGWTVLGSTTPLTFAVSTLAGIVLFLTLHRNVRAAARNARPSAFAIFAVSLGAASFSEEVLWRGVALSTLVRTEAIALALGATTVGFAVTHVIGQGWPGVRVHLLTGALFGSVFLVTGHLADAIAAHGAYNLSLFASVRGRGESSSDLVIVT